MGQRRFSERDADSISPNISIIRSCGSTPMLCTESIPPPPLLILYPIPCLSDFHYPYSFGVGRSTRTGVIVIHSPRSTFFYIPPKSTSAPDSKSLIEVLLQDFRNTYTCLWILSIRSTPKRGSFAKELSYYCSKRSM